MNLMDRLNTPRRGPVIIGKPFFDFHSPRRGYHTFHLACVPGTGERLAFKKLFLHKNKDQPYNLSHLIELATNKYMKLKLEAHDTDNKELDFDNPEVGPHEINLGKDQYISAALIDEEISHFINRAYDNCSSPMVTYRFVTNDERELYLGDPEQAWFYHKKKLGPFYSTFGYGKPANVAYDPINDQWVGWSHRAMVGFKTGDALFRENEGDENTPFKQYGNKKCQDMNDAFLAACNFANYIN